MAFLCDDYSETEGGQKTGRKKVTGTTWEGRRNDARSISSVYLPDQLAPDPCASSFQTLKE
jgi:hypothetical protein